MGETMRAAARPLLFGDCFAALPHWRFSPFWPPPFVQLSFLIPAIRQSTPPRLPAPWLAVAGSGWQYEGAWGGVLGTPIAPHFFVTAAHVGRAGSNFLFQGSSYTIVQSFTLPKSDLLIWQVKETFPSFASLYWKQDEVGKHLLVFGRGTQRGDPLTFNGTARGWSWGAGDGVQRWGENDVNSIVVSDGHDLLYATFDQHLQADDHPNESHLSANDSGGGIFLKDDADTVWKLAAINFAVDDLYSASDLSTAFTAAVFDARDYYSYDGTNFTQLAGANPVPTGFYGSRISSELPWIGSVIANPQVGMEAGYLTLTYSKLLAPSSVITYTVEQSSDLIAWTTATPQEEIGLTIGDLQTVKAKVSTGTAARLFLRLRINRP